MKKTELFLTFLLFGLTMFAQYTGNKLPSGLTVADTTNDADYTIIQKSGETYVKAIRMDSLRSYMTEEMAANVIELDSVAGNTGQFIISDGSGWLAPVSAKYEGGNGYTFGLRGGSVGYASFLTGGATSYVNIASGNWSFIGGGYGNTASGTPSFCSGLFNTASGVASTSIGYDCTSSISYAFSSGYRSVASGTSSTALGSFSIASNNDAVAIAGGIASGGRSFAVGFGSEASATDAVAINGAVASGDRSAAINQGTASGDNSFAVGLGAVASGDYSTAWLGAVASGYKSTAWLGGYASGENSTAWIGGVASGDKSTAWIGGSAQSYLETSFGQYVDTAATKTTDSWVATDRLLTIGNGTGEGSESNALVMLKNGNTTANGNWTIDGDLTVTGNISTSVGARVGAYIPEDSTLTQTVVANVWEFMGDGDNNKFVNIYTNSFTFTGDTLQYTGEDSIYAHIEWGGTVESSVVTTDVCVTIYINDVEQPQFKTSTRTGTAGEMYPLAGCSNIALLPPDATIKIYVRANKNCDLTFHCFPINLHQIR